MKIKEITNVKEITKHDYPFNETKFTGYLFHGTRRGMLELSKKDLADYFSECKQFILFIKNNINKYIEKKDIEKYWEHSQNYFFADSFRIMNFERAKNFQYGSFYLTTNYLSAINFSALGGELGALCYYNAIAIRDLKIKFKEENINLLTKKIITKYEEILTTESIVLCVKDVLFDDLLSEYGDQIFNCGYDNFYKKRIYSAKVTNISKTNFNLRLIKNLNNYNFYLIPQKLLKSYISTFTEIKTT